MKTVDFWTTDSSKAPTWFHRLPGMSGKGWKIRTAAESPLAGGLPFQVSWGLDPGELPRETSGGGAWVNFRAAPGYHAGWLVALQGWRPLAGTGVPVEEELPLRPFVGGGALQLLTRAALLLPADLQGGRIGYDFVREHGGKIEALYGDHSMVVAWAGHLPESEVRPALHDLGVQVRFDPLAALLVAPNIVTFAGATRMVEPVASMFGKASRVWAGGPVWEFARLRLVLGGAFWDALAEALPQ